VDGSELPRDAVAQLEHHRLLCTECDEHVQRLVLALEIPLSANTTGC
jgi:hypothetical protein